jgi:hypothetical protein
MSVFIEKTGSMQDIIEEARKEFKFSEEGTGILRLVFSTNLKLGVGGYLSKSIKGSEIYLLN